MTEQAQSVDSASPTAAIGCPHFNYLETIGSADPHPWLARVRQEGPVYYDDGLQGYVVTRYEDVAAMLKDPETFSSTNKTYDFMSIDPEARAIVQSSYLGPSFANVLLDFDGADHRRQRSVVNRAFSARRVAAMEPRVRQLAHMLVDRFIDQGQTDIVANFAHALPVNVIFTFIGIPEDDWSKVAAYCHAHSKLFFHRRPREEQLQYAQQVLEFEQYTLDLIARRRAAPQDDFMSDVIAMVDSGEQALTEAEQVQLLGPLLIGAGFETTVNLIGSTIYHLLRDPQRWDNLRAAPERIPAVVEEILRLESPAPMNPRRTIHECQIGGVTIPEGARVFGAMASANHDEQLFAEPHAFDPARSNVDKHLAFSAGAHYCLGAPLARLEGRVALEVLVERVPSLRLVPDQEISWIPSVALRGPARLDVAWDLTERAVAGETMDA